MNAKNLPIFTHCSNLDSFFLGIQQNLPYSLAPKKQNESAWRWAKKMDLPAVLRDDGVGLAEKVAAVEAVQTWTPEAVTNNFEMLWDVLSVRCCHVATRVACSLRFKRVSV
jgi:hypothetical protein